MMALTKFRLSFSLNILFLLFVYPVFAEIKVFEKEVEEIV